MLGLKLAFKLFHASALHWRHTESDDVSNDQPHDCLLNRLFSRRSKKISKLRVTGLYDGNSSVTGEFPAQRASNAVNVSIWWRHHALRHEVSNAVIWPYDSTCRETNNIRSAHDRRLLCYPDSKNDQACQLSIHKYGLIIAQVVMKFS